MGGVSGSGGSWSQGYANVAEPEGIGTGSLPGDFGSGDLAGLSDLGVPAADTAMPLADATVPIGDTGVPVGDVGMPPPVSTGAPPIDLASAGPIVDTGEVMDHAPTGAGDYAAADPSTMGDTGLDSGYSDGGASIDEGLA
jgi:hypothetical protein